MTGKRTGKKTGKRLKQGYTLSELVIVIAIIGILASIVYPAYTQHMLETRRTDGWVALNTAAADQQRWHSVNFTYTSDIENLGGPGSAEGFYTVTVVADTSTFTLTATANSSGVQANDTGCTLLTLSETGVQLPIECW